MLKSGRKRVFFSSHFLASGKHAESAPFMRPLIGPESVQRFFTGKTGFRGSTPPNGAGTHRTRRRTALRGEFRGRHPLRRWPTRRPSRGTTRRSAIRPRGGAPRCRGRHVVRGQPRGMAVAVGDWRTRPAQTLGEPPEMAPRGAGLQIQGLPPLCEEHPSGRTRRAATR
jgi:hypothetical protein